MSVTKRTWAVFALGIIVATTGIVVSESLTPRGWVAAAPPEAKALSNQFALVAKAVSPAVVHIRVEQVIKAAPQQNPLEDFLRRYFGEDQPGLPQAPQTPQMPREFRREGLGSGLIVSEDGFILTNNHVVRGATTLTVKLSDATEFKGTVIGTDPLTDLAVVKIDAKGIPWAPLGDSSKLEIGNWVLAIGNPFGLDRTVTAGIVSATGRQNVGVAGYEDFIQTDAAVNPGNSGGPLVNIDGEVVGITTAIASQSGGNIGIGFAIPSNMIKRIMADLKGPKHKVTRAWLGVQMSDQDLTADLAKQFGLDRARGVVITDVIKGTPADAAGLKQGDIVLAIDGTTVNNRQQLAMRVAETKPGAKVTLTIWRDKKEMKVEVTLSERSENAGLATQPSSFGTAEQLGIGVQELADDLAAQLGVKGEKGVVVRSVEQGGPAARAGIKPGDLIQRVGNDRVTSVAEFTTALAKQKLEDGILVLYRRKDASNFVVLKP